MTVRLDISPDLEAWLQDQSSAAGLSVEAFMLNLLAQASARQEQENLASAGTSIAASVLESEDFSDWE